MIVFKLRNKIKGQNTHLHVDKIRKIIQAKESLERENRKH